MKMKAVFHVDELDKWELVLANVSNLIKGVGPEDAEIAIVANSKAVLFYKKDFGSGNHRLEGLTSLGVMIIACNNSLGSLKIETESLFPFVKIVPIGVRELVERQMDGYAYIKP